MSTQNAGTAGDVETFDASSIIDFLTMTASPGYTPAMAEQLRIFTRNLTTGEATISGTAWTVIRKRGRLC